MNQIKTRRQMLREAGAGFGMLGLAGTLQSAGVLSAEAEQTSRTLSHFAAKAKRVIFLFMNGGPSHVDTFDPKPALAKYEGTMPEGKLHKKPGAGYLPSPFEFKPRGQSGVVMSELFPQLAHNADDLCVIRSMHTDVPNHEPGLLLMNSGNQQPIRPSLGSWVSYGLGSENQSLPSYVVLCPGLPVVGPQLWSNAFLPGEHQGMSVDTNHSQVEKLIANLRHPKYDRSQQSEQLTLLNKLNKIHALKRSDDPSLDSHIQSLEMAFRMQIEASNAFDLSKETATTRTAYGESLYGRSCLMARRLVENGVRFVQVYYIDSKNKQPWDSHQDNVGRHKTLCRDSDQATAALLTDLKQRGLLEDTLVIWSGEFGRTPYAQLNGKKKNNPGRDHHHTGFTTLLAGAGVRGGSMYGTTDEFGMNAAENPVHVHDLHATVLHLLGMDHTKLTYRYSGRDFRLTDVQGKVVKGILS